MQLINDTLLKVKVGTATAFRNLTMFPLLKVGGGQPDYLTLDEALSSGSARVTEVSEGGSVPELKFVNDSSRPVLLLDGEELIGAKQNRILNLTILVAAGQSLVIPVSCVEQGRWAHQSVEFSSSPRSHHSTGRALKMASVSESLAAKGTRHSNQGEVWADISAKAGRLRSASPTQAMADIYEQHSTSIEDFVRAFSHLEAQVGALFAINGAVMGFDLFDYAITLQKVLPKLVRSYALDAIDSHVDKPACASASAAEELLLAVTKAEAKTFPAIASGEDVRLTGDKLTGGALVANERVVHLSAFRLEDSKQNQTESVRTTLSRASMRRQQSQAR